MSDTPETDGITFFATKDMMPPYNTVPAEFARKLERERDDAREALRDMLSGWKYIRSVHGDLYGVGWDRAQSKAETALEGTK